MATRLIALAASAAAAAAAAADAPWTIVAPNVATIITGIACTSNKTCYVPADENGVGATVLRSSDGGDTWRATREEPFALLLLDAAAIKENVAIVGALSLMYSTDGAVTFNESLAPFGAGQCIRAVGPKGAQVGFGAVGDWGFLAQSNGVALSLDEGKVYTAENITVLLADSRYGAFPTSEVFYIAAGDWPGEGADDDPCDDPPCAAASARRGGRGGGGVFKRRGDLVDPAHYTVPVAPGSRLVRARGSRLHLLQAPGAAPGAPGGLQYATVRREARAAANAGPNGTTDWEAQIAKTEDGGKTWQRVFSKIGAYYLNDIECTTVETCCAVAETGSGTNGTDGGGAYILCTEDGGKTWKEEHVNTDPDASITGIAAISEKEFWAVGGHLGLITVQYTQASMRQGGGERQRDRARKRGLQGEQLASARSHKRTSPRPVQFYHSLDAGSSWTRLDDPNGNFTFNDAIDIDCEIGENCWVATLDVLTQESSIGRLR